MCIYLEHTCQAFGGLFLGQLGVGRWIDLDEIWVINELCNNIYIGTCGVGSGVL